jgi:hypothetical protein
LGVRKGGPNVEITVDTAAGASDQFLSLTTSTRNNAGIAAKSILVANFGAEHVDNKTIDMDEPDVKRFKGALDQYFQQQLSGVSLPPAVPPCPLAVAARCSARPPKCQCRPAVRRTAAARRTTARRAAERMAVRQVVPRNRISQMMSSTRRMPSKRAEE